MHYNMSLNNNQKYKLLIVGGGGIGGLFSYRCSQSSKVEITVVCRSNYEAVKQNGFHIDSCTWGNQVYKPDHVVANIEEAIKLNESYDFVIITTKTHHPDQIVQLIKPVVSNQTCIVLIQNGVELEDLYMTQFPNNSLISVVTFVGVHQMKSGYLEHLLPFKMNFGNGRYSPDDYLPHDLSNIDKFESIIIDSGIDYFVTDEMRMVRWHKVQFNGTLGIITVLTGGNTIQTVLTNPYTSKLVDDAIKEVAGVAKKLMGRDFPNWLPSIEMHNKQVINNSSPYKPSISIDFERGLPLEFESTLGNFIKVADELDYPVPIAKTNYALLRLLDAKNISKNLN